MNADPKTFSLELAQLCAAACAESYTSATIVDAVTDTQVLVKETDDYLIVAFRGSSSRQDWVTDCEAWRVPYLDCQIHAGFLRAITSVRLPVVKAIQNTPFLKPLLITGHSLGGALAMLFAHWLDHTTHTGQPLHSVYTFGQPRVGNGAFARRYNEALGEVTFRVVHQEDIVPRVPGVLLGYRHAGQSVFLNSFGRLAMNPKLWAVALSDAFGIWSDWSRAKKLSLLSDHNLREYITALEMKREGWPLS